MDWAISRHSPKSHGDMGRPQRLPIGIREDDGIVYSAFDKYAEKHGGEVLTNTKHWHQVRRGEADYKSRLFY